MAPPERIAKVQHLPRAQVSGRTHGLNGLLAAFVHLPRRIAAGFDAKKQG